MAPMIKIVYGEVECDQNEEEVPRVSCSQGWQIGIELGVGIKDVKRQELQESTTSKSNRIITQGISNGKLRQTMEENKGMECLSRSHACFHCWNSRQCDSVSIKGAHGTLTGWRHTPDSRFLIRMGHSIEPLVYHSSRASSFRIKGGDVVDSDSYRSATAQSILSLTSICYLLRP